MLDLLIGIIIALFGIILFWLFMMIGLRLTNNSAKKPPKLLNNGVFILEPSKAIGIMAIFLFLAVIFELTMVLIFFDENFNITWIIGNLIFLSIAVYCAFVSINYRVMIKDNIIIQTGILGNETSIGLNEIAKIECDMFNMKQIIYTNDKKIYLHYQVYGYYYLWNLIKQYYSNEDYDKAHKRMELMVKICKYM